jgi:hypothetical protein
MATKSTPISGVKKIVIPAGKKVVSRIIRPPVADPAEVLKKAEEIKAATTPAPVVKDSSYPLRYIVEMSDGTLRYAEGRHAAILVQYLYDCQLYAASKGANYYDGPPLEIVKIEDYLKKREEEGRSL